VFALALAGLALGTGCAAKRAPATFTVGDLRAMHADVVVKGREVRGTARLSDGDDVKTGPDGRARVRLDDGTLVVVDASTSFTLRGASVTLSEGRLFVQGGAMSHADVTAGGASTAVSSSAAAFEVGKGTTKIYCAQGELMVRAAGRQEHVASGETATLSPAGPKVQPEAAFDDWTGGLAVPWSGDLGENGAIPELWGGAQGEAPGTALVVRSANVDVTLDGEVAVTRARTTYFNGSDRAVAAEVRMTLPPGAVVSKVARSGSSAGSDDVEAVLLPTRPNGDSSPIGRLEWAGGGSLRGLLPDIGAGKTADLLVEYVEWLPVREGRATYRFPMGSSSDPPSIGEFSAEVKAERTSSPWITASAGASVTGSTVTLRQADVRPTHDLVVEVSPAVVERGSARAYVTPGEKGEDPYVVVRTEVPEVEAAGVALAVVVDASTSIGAASLEMERAVVDALLEGLGSRDRLVVLAADQTVRPIGSGEPKPVNAALRAEVEKGLAALRPGGASDLGSALERAADVLDAPSVNQASGMVVYVGDGRPTVGEEDAREIRKRLGRRVGGVPRIGAIAVGSGADRWMLAQLVTGSSPIYEVSDRADAAQVGAALLADALEPTLRDVDLDLGGTIDRIYPREARAALSGSTVTVAGRLRGKLPEKIGFRFRRGAALVQEMRTLTSVPIPTGADVPQRWAAARIEEMAARGDGIESAIAIASKARLLTPWTSWFFTGADTFSVGVPFEKRVLGLSPAIDAAYAARVEPALRASSLLLEPPRSFGGGVSLREAVEMAARREINATIGSLVACRDARATVRPDIAASLRIDLTIDGAGHSTRIHVAADGAGNDPVFDRCAETVLSSIAFFDSGLTVSMSHRVTLPEGRASRKTKCSPAAALPLAVRKGLWLWGHCSPGAECAGLYVAKARMCELPRWRDRRELLEILLKSSTSQQTLSTAAALDAAGEPDAASYLRKEALRRVTTIAELEVVRRIIMQDEPLIDGELDKAYQKAKTDEDRLAVVRRFLRIAPHSALGRRRLFALLERLGRRDALVQEIERARNDPFADAGLLAAGASALRRAGSDQEGRRAFGELIERAPGDPWTLGYVGDRLRGEGLFDEATAAYESLDRALPDDPAVLLRLGLAHAGAGRLDVATRLLDRVAQTGGRGDDGGMGELASVTEAVLLAAARGASPGPEVDAQLVRRLVQTPLPDVASVVVVRSAPGDDPVTLSVVRNESKDEDPADLDATDMGLSAVRIERGQAGARIRLRRSAADDASRPLHASVAVLVLADDRASSRLVTREVDVDKGRDGVELRFNGETLL
jgi:tetratricopeptide (TPR) repeat protein